MQLMMGLIRSSSVARSTSSGNLSSAMSKSRLGFQYATLVRTLVRAPRQSCRASLARELALLERNYPKAPRTPSKNRVSLVLGLTFGSGAYPTFGIPMVASSMVSLPVTSVRRLI